MIKHPTAMSCIIQLFIQQTPSTSSPTSADVWREKLRRQWRPHSWCPHHDFGEHAAVYGCSHLMYLCVFSTGFMLATRDGILFSQIVFGCFFPGFFTQGILTSNKLFLTATSPVNVMPIVPVFQSSFLSLHPSSYHRNPNLTIRHYITSSWPERHHPHYVLMIFSLSPLLYDSSYLTTMLPHPKAEQACYSYGSKPVPKAKTRFV